jgi:hypothetical protein
MEQQITVHGSIFFLLKKFIDNNFPIGAWDELVSRPSVNQASFELTHAYPLEKISGIISEASAITGLSAETLKERFGEYMVPDLFNLYKNYLQPDWRTFDVLLHTEKVMHGAVRKYNSTAHPPILNVSKVSEKLVIIDYYSKRKMSNLAVGIIKGIAKYFEESELIKVEPTTDFDSERVQIKVHFRNLLYKVISSLLNCLNID